MNTKKSFFNVSLSIIISMCSLSLMPSDADAARTPIRGTPVARKAVVSTQSTTTTSEESQSAQTEPETVDIPESAVNEPEPIIENKSSQFGDVISTEMESTNSNDDTFAESIRRQRAALAASEASTSIKSSQQSAIKSGRNACDTGLRECMKKTCGDDFTKCATDGDTMFGDKLNRCRKDVECNGEEFRLFTTEIKADRDMNVKLASYNRVINCGNNYNKCIQDECGQTFAKCLGKSAADMAIQKCSTIARECSESDSGLASRFGVVIGKLRENAEKGIKKDEERMYALRDLMRKQCTSLGAMFDERTFDCVYTVNFFAGDNQTTPMSSRKRYAGDAFICSQEWFGINATTYKENAYRETRAQTAASAAMLGSGLGTAAGMATSGAIGRAWDVQKAKKALDAETAKKSGAGNTTPANNKEKQPEQKENNNKPVVEGGPTKTELDKRKEDAKKELNDIINKLPDPSPEEQAAIDKLHAKQEREQSKKDAEELRKVSDQWKNQS